MNEKLVAEYANHTGAVVVWKSWKEVMLEQGRDVNEKFMQWPIPARDIELDADIAFAVIGNFLEWCAANYALHLTSACTSTGTHGATDNQPRDTRASG